jgi:hypothetical protein
MSSEFCKLNENDVTKTITSHPNFHGDCLVKAEIVTSPESWYFSRGCVFLKYRQTFALIFEIVSDNMKH